MGQKTGNTLQSFQLLADEKRYDIAKTKFKLFHLNIAIASYLAIYHHNPSYTQMSQVQFEKAR